MTVVKVTTKQAFFILSLSLLFGVARQYFPQGIKWAGKWPTSSTSALDAYNMMAQEGDPPFVSLEEVIELQRTKSGVLLDARAYKEFIQGRIPDARSLPYYEIDQYQEVALKGLKSDTPLVIYCEGVGCELSFFLGRELQKAGYQKIRIFYGGYPEWREAGFPIEK